MKALIARMRRDAHAPADNRGWSLIQKRAFVLVTVYSDADRSTLSEIRDVKSVKHVDMVLGAFDAVVTVEEEDDAGLERVVADISRARGVKEAKPLVEVQPSRRRDVRPVIGRRAA